YRPGQAERCVQRVGPELAGRVVARRAQIGDRAVVFEGHERVPEALGDVYGAPIDRIQAHRVPLPERRRSDPDVDDHVEDAALRAIDVLGLAGRDRRVVDAPQYSAPRYRM